MSSQLAVCVGMRRAVCVVIAALVIAVCLGGCVGGEKALGASSSASPTGSVYWAQSANGGSAERGSIARATLEGSAVIRRFIGGTTGGGGVATEGGYVYWTNYGGTGYATGTIGRAKLDGTGVNERFITGALWPTGVAVDGRHVYWTNYDSIARANLSGTGRNVAFIKAYAPTGLATDEHHIYWTSEMGDHIGRANLDGTSVNPQFITATNAPVGIAVDAGYVYWSNVGDDTIGRATLNGTDATERCIAIGNVPIGNAAEGLALDGRYAYWSNYPANSIARAKLDGTGVNEHFITVKGVPEGIAISETRVTGARSANEPPCPPSHAQILLGAKGIGLGPYAEGWGEAAPPTISNGGASASGTISSIRWSSWGGNVAVGRGLNPIFMPQGGYYQRPAVIELRASRIRRCTPGGPLVYTYLNTREPSKPDGPFGPWQPWTTNMCA